MDNKDMDLTADERELLAKITLSTRPDEITTAEEAQKSTIQIQEHIDRFTAELSKLELPRAEIDFRIKEEKIRVAKLRLEQAKYAQREVTIYWAGDNAAESENIMLDKTTDLLIDSELDAWTVCRQVACKNGLELEQPWGLVIYDQSLSILRAVEDHEIVLDIIDSWKARNITTRQLFFRPEAKKYHMFDSPAAYFNDLASGVSPDWTRSERKLAIRVRFLTEFFKVTPANIPELEEELHIRIGLKKWKKVKCMVCEEGIFYEKTKDKGMIAYATFSHTHFFETVNYDRLFKAPTSAVTAIEEDDNKEDFMKAICFDDRFKQVSWYMALRIGTFSNQLLLDFEYNARRMKLLKSLQRHGASFTAKTGRRVTGFSIFADRMNGVEINIERGSDYHLDWSHKTADWFHGKVSRAQQQTCLERLGGQNGLYLVRESSTTDGQCVLVLCHKGNILNFLISEQDGGYVVGDSKPYPKMQHMIDALHENLNGLPCKLNTHAPRILSVVLTSLVEDGLASSDG